MTVPPENVRVVRQWIEKAGHDLRTAEHTLTLVDDCPFDTVCFHAQQCAEKYLKGLLAFHGTEFPKTHDLFILKNLLAEITPLDLEGIPLQSFNRYSVEARYPGEWEPIDRTDAEEAVGNAKRVRDAVRAVLPADIF